VSTTAVAPPPFTAPQPRPSDRLATRPALRIWLPPLLVLAAGLAGAAGLYAHFLEVERTLWTSPAHDRNAHFVFGLNVALDLRHADSAQLFSHLDGARMWPPLHGMILGLVLAVGGPDYRLGVLPSLAAWVAAAVLAFLVARRAVPRGGNLAGAVAAVCFLVSPAYRAFATDVMLEGLGACLSLLALYCYLVAVQDEARPRGAGLGLVLTLLCLHKYNYWLLVVFALIAAELTGRWAVYRGFAGRTVAAWDWRGWLKRQARQPLSWLAVALAAGAVFLVRGGGEGLAEGVSAKSPHNVVTAAYLCVFVQLAWWWHKQGAAWSRTLDPRWRQILAWHLWPVAAWFLWPKRLSYFLWFTFANPGEHPQSGLWSGLQYHLGGVVTEYHVAAWSAAVVGGLVLAALATARRLRPGGAVVLWFVLIALVLTSNHPNRKHRFLHSWLAAGWCAAGMGAAGLLGLVRRERLRPWLAGAAACGLTLAHLPGLTAAGYAEEGGPLADHGSTLDVTDAYLPDLAGAKHPFILANVPLKHLARWTYLERYGRAAPLETEIKHFGGGPEASRQAFARWLETTPCDRLVFVDVPPGTPFEEGLAEMAGLREALEGQTVFRCARRQAFPAYGCTVSVWVRP
jgi:hypothetical protein